MRFRTVVIAAAVLVIAIVGGLAVYEIADASRSEAAQTTVEQEDSLAVEEDIRQKLVADDDHDPTAYGDSITVEYDGTEWDEGEDYEYHQDSGEIEFLRDESGEADIDYTYEIPEDQVADDQLETLTIGVGEVVMVIAGLTFVVLFLFIGRFVATRMGVGNSKLKTNR